MEKKDPEKLLKQILGKCEPPALDRSSFNIAAGWLDQLSLSDSYARLEMNPEKLLMQILENCQPPATDRSSFDALSISDRHDSSSSATPDFEYTHSDRFGECSPDFRNRFRTDSQFLAESFLALYSHVLTDLLETTKAFVIVHVFGEHIMDREWFASFMDIFPVPDWEKVQKTLAVNLEDHEVPVPRQRILDKFHCFSKQDLHLFNRIYYSFVDDQNGLFRLKELTYLVNQLGRPLDCLSLKYIFDKGDQDKDKNLSLGEFLNLFRLENNGPLDVLSVFKDIEHNARARYENGDTFMVVVKHDEVIGKDELVQNLSKGTPIQKKVAPSKKAVFLSRLRVLWQSLILSF